MMTELQKQKIKYLFLVVTVSSFDIQHVRYKVKNDIAFIHVIVYFQLRHIIGIMFCCFRCILALYYM